MAGLAFPLAVEVVGHHVDKVQVGSHGGDIVAALDVVGPDGDGGGEEQAGLLDFLGFGFEGFAQL